MIKPLIICILSQCFDPSLVTRLNAGGERDEKCYVSFKDSMHSQTVYKSCPEVAAVINKQFGEAK